MTAAAATGVSVAWTRELQVVLRVKNTCLGMDCMLPKAGVLKWFASAVNVFRLLAICIASLSLLIEAA